MPGLNRKINLPEFDFPDSAQYAFADRYKKYVCPDPGGPLLGVKKSNGAFDILSDQQTQSVIYRAFWYASRFIIGMTEADARETARKITQSFDF
jgi:hypothetical protein